MKLRRDKPKVSYLCYPTFDTEAHPPLTETFVVDLRRQRTNHYEYSDRENPPVLHRKECFVASRLSAPAAFAALTSAEAAADSSIHLRESEHARLGRRDSRRSNASSRATISSELSFSVQWLYD